MNLVSNLGLTVLKETKDYALAVNPNAEPTDIKTIDQNYFIVHKPTLRVENTTNSYVNALMYLQEIQKALNKLVQQEADEVIEERSRLQ
jgi:hypothetical protein